MKLDLQIQQKWLCVRTEDVERLQKEKGANMYGNEWKKWVSGTGRVLLAYALLYGQSAWAGQDPKAPDKTSATPKLAANQTGEKQRFSPAAAAKMQNHEVEAEASENVRAEEKSSGDGSHEGIKVHGHWTIEVRNPDGSLAMHREFENSLIQSQALSSFLSRTFSVGYWFIQFSAGSQVCQAGGGTDCTIIEAAAGVAPSNFVFNTLVVGTNANNLVLSGTVVAPLSGNISGVQTVVGYCLPTTPVSSPCKFASSFFFTGTTLSSPIQVSAGQTVAVTVNISFS